MKLSLLSLVLPIAGVFIGAMASATPKVEARSIDFPTFLSDLNAKVIETAAALS